MNTFKRLAKALDNGTPLVEALRRIKEFSFNDTSVETLNISNIPTSSDGLVSGDVWSNSGVLTIVS